MPDPQPNLPTDVKPATLAGYVCDREQLFDGNLNRTSKLNFYTNLAPLILSQLTGMTEAPFPSATIASERVLLKGKMPLAVPASWPIVSVSKALIGGIGIMRIGTLLQLDTGNADIAIETGARSFRVAGVISSAVPGVIYVDYVAGYDAMPADLLEVFVELALLVSHEHLRVGVENVRVDLGLAKYVRTLPHWCQVTLARYRRLEHYF